jgi:hypothetical protein
VQVGNCVHVCLMRSPIPSLALRSLRPCIPSCPNSQSPPGPGPGQIREEWPDFDGPDWEFPVPEEVVALQRELRERCVLMALQTLVLSWLLPNRWRRWKNPMR